MRKPALIILLLTICAVCKIFPAEKPVAGKEGAVICSYNFTGEKPAAGWRWLRGKPGAVNKGEGAFGTRGFLRMEPDSSRVLYLFLNLNYEIGPDTWLGFSARSPKGAKLNIMLAERKSGKNIARKMFQLPADGSWKTVRIPFSDFMTPNGTGIKCTKFFINNKERRPISFDLDNVVIGSGAKLPPPGQVKNLTGAFDGQKVKLSWTPSYPTAGISGYKIYRGLYPGFKCDKSTLWGTVATNSFADSAFAHKSTYYYKVAIVDFTGRETPDCKAVAVVVK